MSTTKDGGPAFPVPDLHPGAMQVGSSGMSLRDWFAGQALAGLVSEHGRYDSTGAAMDAYTIADAMLRARERGQESDGDEAWFAKQPDACVSVAEDMSWASCEARERIIAERGSTRAAAIRALRAKVEGGAQ